MVVVSFTAADWVTLTGYGLGLWWTQGGPAWAGLASIVADELDGQVARAHGSSARGSALDWGADVALTPLALGRLGRELGHPELFFAAPVVLAAQASMRAAGERPTVGSARALAMLAAIVLEDLQAHAHAGNGRGRGR